MLDNALIQVFLPIMRAGLDDAGFSMVPIVQTNQPTLQGIDYGAMVYFCKVTDHRYGWVKRDDYWSVEDNQEKHSEQQTYESTFQCGALAIQDPADITKPTASDLANIVAAILQRSTTIETLLQSDVQILKITDVQNPYFTDDRDQFEANPHFDFTLIQQQINISNINVISEFQPGIYRV